MAEAAPAEGFEGDVEELVAEARPRPPDLRATEAQVKAAQTNRDAVQAGGRSPLSFGATAGAQGIFFGFYPAKKAPQLDPIESLRYQ